MASASIESAELSSARGSSTFTMCFTWSFSACPAPTTDFFTTLGAYSATLMPSQCRSQHGRSPCLTQLQRRPRILVHEGFFDGRFIGRIALQNLRKLRVDLQQPRGQRRIRIGMDAAIGHIGEPRSLCLDNAPARIAQARINADDADLRHPAWPSPHQKYPHC